MDVATIFYTKVELFKSNERVVPTKFKYNANNASKHVLTLLDVDEQKQPVLRRELNRGQCQDFLANYLARNCFRKLIVGQTVDLACSIPWTTTSA